MFSQKKFGLPESLLKAVAEAMHKSHTVPKTEKEKKLAALAEPKDKITHADVLTGRGVKKEDIDLDEETPSKQQVKQAIGIARDKRYAKGNVSGAVKAMDKLNPGLAQHPVVKKELQKQNEEVEELDEIGPGRADPKAKDREESEQQMKDFLARGGSVQTGKTPKTRGSNRMVARGSLSGKERMVNPFGGKSFVKRMGEEAELTEAPVDGVAAGSMEGEKHLCASKVMHKEWKEGTPLFSQHAEPSEDGFIQWYDVMFEHGIEKRVPVSELEILVSESHMNHKKKGK